MALNNVDLSTYVRVGRYDLPEPKRTTPPTNSLLAREVSAVTYNWDTDTLFVVGDGSTSIVQVSKTGQLINSMTLALGSSPQGTDFYDTEGLTYVGGGQFVLIEERDRQASLFTYTAGTTLTKSNVKTVKLGTTVGNIGIEGISWDPQTNGFIAVKEITPEGIFQTTIDFVAGTASNGSPTTVNSTDLFDPAKAGIADFADVFALSNLSALNGKADSSNILILSQESGKIVKSDRAGNISSSLTIVSDPGNPLSIADQQHEGLTMDKDGYLYVVSENGGGDIDHPQLWVYAPSTVQVDGTEAGKTAVSAGFKGQTIFNTGFIPSGAAGTVNGQQVALGGLSGVTYDAVNNRYYAISDDRSSNARFYTFTLDPVTNAVTFTNVVQLKNINGNPFAVNSLDTEGIALTSNGTILISSEGEVRPDLGASRVTNPFIKEFNLTTGQEIGSLPVPNKFLPVLQDTNNNNVVDTGDTQTSGVRNNLAFESLTITPDQKTLFTATESALFQDGAISTTTTSSRSRIIQYNLVTGQPEKEYLYVTDPIAKSPTGGTAADNGLVDLLAIDNRGTLLALERSFAVGQGNKIKIYEITLQGATDINTVDSLSSLNANQLSAIQPAQKRLLLNLDSLNLPNSDGNHPTGTDNIEGLALGPKLADGTQSIVLVSDNNFSSTQFTQILTLSADVTAINQAPTAVVLNNKISAIAENTSTSPAIKVADITITDDGLGTNTLSLTGTDASSFEITNNGLFIKTGTTLDFETKTSYSVNVNVDDTTVGNTPDATTAFTLAVTDVVNETPTNSSIFITEVAPWSSGNSPVAADWFELTNKGTSAVNITGWKFDDNSNSFASAVALSGITSIGAGESVIFIEGATVNTIFRPNWFGANPPASLQIGNYTGSGVGLSTSGDAVNIYNATGVLQANVVFGVSPAGPFATFDNAALLNNATISTLSAAGVNGAFVAVNSNAEIGSPGRINAPATSGITLTQTGGTTNVTEGGATDSYTIVLNSQPTADVAIAINPNSQLTTSAVTLTFTPANWNVAQNVTVTAVDDVIVEGSHSGEITHSVTSTDAQYNNITINPIVVSITDNVNDAPTLANTIADQNAKQGDAFSFQIPTNTFTDIDAGDVLTYSATLENGNALPTWLTFNSTTRTFSGTPTNDNVGNLNIKAIATDKAGATVSDIFVIAVENVNDAPVLSNAIADQNAKQGTAFSFQIPTNTFTDIDAGDVLTYSATLENGNALPNWLTFNSTTRTFSGTPTNDNVGNLNVKVAATDKTGASVNDTFTIKVQNVNTAPILKNPLLDQTVKVNSTFTFTLPKDTFSDPDAVNPYKNLVIFGDSLSDTGNAYKASGNTFPPSPNYQGRLSNGLIWVDYFAPDLQFTNPSIQNYAFLGANTGVSNTFGQITVPGLLTQIQQFKTVNTNSIGKDGLYVIWAGANDFLNLATDPTQAVTNAVTNISSAITTLAGLGAKEIVVGNLTDLGATPLSIANNNVANARAISIGFNAALTQALTNLEPALNVDLSLVDIFGLSTAFQTNPANYKFTNITQPLITVTTPVNPDQYAFWDDVHPTTRLHQLVTDTFENTLLNDGVIPDLIKYSATLADGSNLPDWLNFNSTTRTFSGTPNIGNVGKLDVKVIATDKAGATVNDIFTLAVNQSTTVGTPGDDKLIATPGSQFDGQNNIVFTGAGKDEVDLSTVSAFPNSGNNIVDLGSGEDTIFVNKGDRAFGSDGNDIFDARDGQGNNRMSGGAGDDIFYLGANDRSLGGDGKDIFRVSLGGGNLISGGAGADQFWIVNAELPKAANTVLDFQLGTDVIGIQGAVSLGITTSTLQLNQVGADTAIVFNNQTLATLTGIQASSLSLTDSKQFVFA
jgi:phospholipase/lecithinase/hemolysin